MRVVDNLDVIPNLEKTVVTIGSFDGIHLGHQKLIKRINLLAREINGTSVVITFHPHPRSVIYPKDKSLKLLTTLDEKLELFKSFGVDFVAIVPFTIEFSQMSAREYVEKFLIQKFHPHYLVIGYDHRFGLNRAGDFQLLQKYEDQSAFNLIEISKKEIDNFAISSTKIRNALNDGDVDLANVLLNHEYLLTGKVEHGDKIGSSIGFPTANIHITDSNKLIPKNGIYASKIIHDDLEFEGMLYIGYRPTINDKLVQTIEVNIFDFNENIYNKTIQVKLISFIRDDRKFQSLEQLRNQLQLDEKEVKSFFKTYNQSIPIPLVSIAILNYNGVHHLESYLDSVSYSSQFPVDNIIVDNGSEDTSVVFCEEWYPEYKIIQFSENYGFAEGYNKAIQEINTPYVAILNSDVLVTENWIDPLIEMLESNPNIGAVMPKILSLEQKTHFEYAGAAGGFIDNFGYPFCRGRVFDTIEEDKGQYDNVADVFWTTGAAMVIRTELYKNLGGFDRDYFAHMEEIDLCWRINNCGYSLKVVPSSKVYHLGGGTLDYGNRRKVFLNFRNSLYTLFKNEDVLKLLWLIPLRLILDGIAGIKFLIETNALSTWEIVKAHFSFYAHIPDLIRKRKRNARLISNHKIGPKNRGSILRSSIIWSYYISSKKKYSDII